MARTFNKKTWLISQLRRLTLRYPPAIRATNRTREEYYILSKKGKPMKRVKYTCADCGKKDLKRSEMDLDHKIPVVDVNTGFTNWEDFINGLFCDEENLWLICKPCHEAKTAEENKSRK
jgi:5-methylcytosine-specific restriction endonuclease McrA